MPSPTPIKGVSADLDLAALRTPQQNDPTMGKGKVKAWTKEQQRALLADLRAHAASG